MNKIKNLLAKGRELLGEEKVSMLGSRLEELVRDAEQLSEEARTHTETLKEDINEILGLLDFPHVDSSRIFCYRTYGSKSRSYARIWAMPKIFQRALDIKPAYVIEVLAKYYDNLDEDSKKKVLIRLIFFT